MGRTGPAPASCNLASTGDGAQSLPVCSVPVNQGAVCREERGKECDSDAGEKRQPRSPDMKETGTDPGECRLRLKQSELPCGGRLACPKHGKAGLPRVPLGRDGQVGRAL